MKHNFTYNGKNSLDLGVVIDSYTITSPSKKKILVEVPYASSDLDFSYALDDENTYNDRYINVQCSVVCKSREELKQRVSQITTWLLETKGKQELTFSTEKHIYMAEVRESIEFAPFDRAAVFSIMFTVSPYRQGHCLEGTYKEWDCFEFAVDVLQESVFNLTTTPKNVTLINVGRKIVPQIKVSGGKVNITLNGYKVELDTGTTTNYSLLLKKGANDVVLSAVSGTAKVEFIWRKELL